MEGDVLKVPWFPSVHNSSKQFGFSFTYDATKVWNELPDDILFLLFLVQSTLYLEGCLLRSTIQSNLTKLEKK